MVQFNAGICASDVVGVSNAIASMCGHTDDIFKENLEKFRDYAL